MEQIAQYYDFSKTIRDNREELLKIGGIPCSKGTLVKFLKWCKITTNNKHNNSKCKRL